MDRIFSPDFYHQQFLGQEVWLWALFLGFVFTLLFVDLFILNKKDHVIELKESLRLTCIYLSLGLLFGLWVWYQNGSSQAADYYTVWLLEQSLSLDNLFVMSVIFTSFQVPRQYQHRVLFWGIMGVIVMRGIMIGAGAALVQEYAEVLLLFAAILVVTGIKMMFMNSEGSEDYSQKPYVKFLAKHMRIDPHLHGSRFFVRLPDHRNPNKALTFATPLFLCLCTIELTDVMFAFDSVPAALAITTDPYIVYTANIFAILGLRAMFFAMEHVLHRFEYLKYSLSIVLVFIGLKVFYVHFSGNHIPAAVSLGITLGVLAMGVVISMLRTRNEPDTEHMTDKVEHK
jgi:tellurite resistance protein TerC